MLKLAICWLVSSIAPQNVKLELTGQLKVFNFASDLQMVLQSQAPMLGLFIPLVRRLFLRDYRPVPMPVTV